MCSRITRFRSKLLAALLTVALPVLAHAESPVVWAYDSGSVAAGAAIDSTAQRAGAVSEITCLVNNAGAGARTLTVNWLADDRTTVLHTETASILAGTKPAVGIAMYPQTSTGNFIMAIAPSRWMQFQLASGGAAAGRITCFGR